MKHRQVASSFFVAVFCGAFCTMASADPTVSNLNPAPPPGSTAEQVYAYISDKPIYASDIAERINELPEATRQQYAVQPGELQTFIENVLIDKMISNAAVGLNLESSDTYARKMRVASEKIIRELYLGLLMNQVPAPSEADINVYYRLHISEFTRPAAIQMMYVLVDDIENANRIYREAREGAVFSSLVATWSTTSDSITTLAIENLPVEIHEQIAVVSNGGIFRPYATTKGIYVFKKLAATPLQIQSLEEVRDTVRMAAQREKTQLFLEAFLEKLKRENPVRIVGSVQQGAPPPMVGR